MGCGANSMARKVEEAQRTTADLRCDLRAAQGESSRLRQAGQKTSKEVEELKEKLQEALREAEEGHRDVEQAQQELQELRGRLDQALRDRDRATEEVQKMGDMVQKAILARTDALNQLQLLEAHETMEAKRRARLDSRCSLLDLETRSLRSELHAARAESEVASALRGEVAAQTAMLARLQAKLPVDFESQARTEPAPAVEAPELLRAKRSPMWRSSLSVRRSQRQSQGATPLASRADSAEQGAAPREIKARRKGKGRRAAVVQLQGAEVDASPVSESIRQERASSLRGRSLPSPRGAKRFLRNPQLQVFGFDFGAFDFLQHEVLRTPPSSEDEGSEETAPPALLDAEAAAASMTPVPAVLELAPPDRAAASVCSSPHSVVSSCSSAFRGPPKLPPPPVVLCLEEHSVPGPRHFAEEQLPDSPTLLTHHAVNSSPLCKEKAPAADNEGEESSRSRTEWSDGKSESASSEQQPQSELDF